MSRTSLSTLVLSPWDAISRASSKVEQPVRRQQRPKKVPPPRLQHKAQWKSPALLLKRQRNKMARSTESSDYSATHTELAQLAPFLQLLLFSVRATLEEQQFSLNLLLSNNLQPVRNPTPSQPSAEGMFLNQKFILLFYNIHLLPSTQRSQS